MMFRLGEIIAANVKYLEVSGDRDLAQAVVDLFVADDRGCIRKVEVQPVVRRYLADTKASFQDRVVQRAAKVFRRSQAAELQTRICGKLTSSWAA